MSGDEEQTRVLPATDDQPVDEQRSEPHSPGARWATGSTDQPAAKETTAEAAAEAPAEVAAKAPAEVAAEAPAEVAAEAPADAETKPVTTDQPTASESQRLPVRDLPAGLDPGELTSAAPGSARRGKLRRRLRYLRHVRELLLRDLGGFIYEIHRTAGGTTQEGHRRLADAKANRIAALDAEVGEIEARLGEPHAPTVLRETGIGGTCQECGELFASDARFCSRCGAPVDAKARAQHEASIAAAAQPTPEPQPASVLWAGGPRPATGREKEEKDQPSAVTSEWLQSRDQPTTADRAAQPDEPAAQEEPAEAGEPATAEPAAAREPATDEPGAAHETAATSEAAAREPATTSEAAADDPAAAEPVEAPAGLEAARAANEPSDAPAGRDEPDEPEPGAPAPGDDPADASAGSGGATAGDSEGRFEPGPNGRREDDVPSSLPSRDPLPSRRGEQAP